MLHIIIFQVNTFFQIDFYYVDERKADFPQKKSLFFIFPGEQTFSETETAFKIRYSIVFHFFLFSGQYIFPD